GAGEAPARACASAPAASTRAGTPRWRCAAPAPCGTAPRSSPRPRRCPSPRGPPPTGPRGRAASPPRGRCDRPPPPPRPRARCSSCSCRTGPAAHQLVPEEEQHRRPAVVDVVLLLEAVPLVQREQVPHRSMLLLEGADYLFGLALRHPGVVLSLEHEHGRADL